MNFATFFQRSVLKCGLEDSFVHNTHIKGLSVRALAWSAKERVLLCRFMRLVLDQRVALQI